MVNPTRVSFVIRNASGLVVAMISVSPFCSVYHRVVMDGAYHDDILLVFELQSQELIRATSYLLILTQLGILVKGAPRILARGVHMSDRNAHEAQPLYVRQCIIQSHAFKRVRAVV